MTAVDAPSQSPGREAEPLAATPGTAAAMTKRLVAAATIGTLDDQLELERQLQQAASEHPAYAESVAAFLAKRPTRAG